MLVMPQLTSLWDASRSRRRLPSQVTVFYFGFCALTVAGCASYAPPAEPSLGFVERAQVKSEGEVTVSAAVLVDAESKAVFGLSLADHDVQPVWLRIANGHDTPYWFSPLALDPDYYSPEEVAYLSGSGLSASAHAALLDFLSRRAVHPFVPARSTVAGYVFTPLDRGAKAVQVLLVGDERDVQLDFVIRVPNLDPDFAAVNLEGVHSPEAVQDVNDLSLQEELRRLPCCAGSAPGVTDADPLNLVLIGDFDTVLKSLVRAGWDLTERLSIGSALGTAREFVFGNPYRNAPISPLYVFGRHQDFGIQRARSTISQRNHLRLWLTPLRIDGRPVWIGQISRDVGVKYLPRRLRLTHAIGSRVDEERWYLMQNLVLSEVVERIGFVAGVGESTPEAPRTNAGGDTYYTDGLRAVLFLAPTRVPAEDVDLLGWARPPNVPDPHSYLLPYAKRNQENRGPMDRRLRNAIAR
jgi:LssY C-terminus